MHTIALLFLSIVALIAPSNAVTVYIAGDSTAAPNGLGAGTQGWGEFLKFSLNVPVVNMAVAGRSARSYTREGRFASLAKLVKPGDIVVIEFGHNDVGSLRSTDNGRTPCAGQGTETFIDLLYSSVPETVLTFPAYLQNAAKLFTAKKTSVIMSSTTPNNPVESGKFAYAPNRFTGFASLAASRTGSSFVDHGQYTANFFQARSISTVNKFFPRDHTHTSAAGANVVAAAFVRGILCGDNPLKAHVKNNTATVEGKCI
ncbi:SGNH hydrolase-type esterase domain-containing protein [Cladochytrium replicatum]|nr:SGNH hydrolase-type esterase domain-containing protein [Cladochytrium replicatum]